MKNTIILLILGCCIVNYSAPAQAQAKNQPSSFNQTAGSAPAETRSEEKGLSNAVAPDLSADQTQKPASAEKEQKPEYAVGIDDTLEINVLQPEKFLITVTVAPDGSITVPYIGSVQAKERTLPKIQEEIQNRLADGYMRYPVVSVSLRESRSKKFSVYGEVVRPGTYLLDEYTTVLKAISMAGGFSKYGSASRVKVLRPGPENKGMEVIKVNINAVMEGNSQEDVQLRSGDTVVVSEGIF